MDLDTVLGSLELPSDQPDWVERLLLRLDETAPTEGSRPEDRGEVEAGPLTGVVLPLNLRLSR